MTKDIVSVGDFCTVESSKFAEYGVKRNDLIYVAGDMVVPVEEKDPYELRRIFIAAKMDGDSVVASGGFTIDGLRLKKVSQLKQDYYDSIKDAEFSIEEELEDGALD